MNTQQELAHSIERHESYLSADSGNISLRMDLGDLYLRAGRGGDALACYQLCIGTPDDSITNSRIASALMALKRFEEAEALLRTLIARDSDSILVHNLGIALYAQERWDDARACFDEANARGLRLADNLAFLTRASHRSGRIAEAITAAEQWVEIDDQATSQCYLAELMLASGFSDGAGQHALAALLRDPDHADAHVVAGFASAELMQTERARAHFEHALKQEPRNARAWLGLGLCILDVGDHAQAIDALDQAVTFGPSNLGAIVALGWALISAGDLSRAAQSFEQAIHVDHNFAEAHGGLATVLALQQKLELAEHAMKVAQRLALDCFGAQFAKGVILTLRDDKASAETVIANLLARTPRQNMRPLIELLQPHRHSGAVGNEGTGNKNPTSPTMSLRN